MCYVIINQTCINLITSKRILNYFLLNLRSKSVEGKPSTPNESDEISMISRRDFSQEVEKDVAASSTSDVETPDDTVNKLPHASFLFPCVIATEIHHISYIDPSLPKSILVNKESLSIPLRIF